MEVTTMGIVSINVYLNDEQHIKYLQQKTEINTVVKQLVKDKLQEE